MRALTFGRCKPDSGDEKLSLIRTAHSATYDKTTSRYGALRPKRPVTLVKLKCLEDDRS